MDISVVYHSIFLIALLIFIGAIVARSYKFNNSTKQMYIVLITNVAMPSIILSSILKVDIDSEMFQMLFIVFIISILINIIGLILGYILSILLKINSKRIEITILSAFGNTGFIGIPLCAVLFGPEGALYAAIFDAGVDFTIWTAGVFVIKNERKFNLEAMKELINIPLIAIISGLIIVYFNIPIPNIFIDLSDSLASFAVPLAMFYIGATMTVFKRSYNGMTFTEISIPIITKLLLLPILMTIFMIFSNFSILLSNVLILQSMMPALTLSSVLFGKYSRDENFGAFVTILSTIFSLLTIPGILYFIEFIV